MNFHAERGNYLLLPKMAGYLLQVTLDCESMNNNTRETFAVRVNTYGVITMPSDEIR